MNKNLCALAWSHTSSDPTGNVRSCCIARNQIIEDGRVMNIAHDSIDSILNSSFMQNLRQDMLEENYPENCKTCWNDEHNGNQSKRQIYNNIFKEFNIEVDYQNPEIIPKDLQLNIGNICNLKCRTCGPMYSSKWNTEWNDRVNDYDHRSLSVDINNPVTSKLWTELDNWSSTIQRLEIMGGEPLYSKDFRRLINGLISNGSSKHISLNFSSNGTVFDEAFISNVLDNFQTVGLNISIDGVGDHFNYIRHGKNWELVDKNIRKFSQLQQTQNARLGISFTVTISMLNIYYLEEIHEYLSQFTDTYIFDNLVYYPEHYDIRHTPLECKSKIKDRLTNSIFEPIVNHLMQSGDSQQFYKFIQETQSADNYRNESFSKTFPELWHLFKPYWNV